MRWCAGDDRLIMRGVNAWGADKVAAMLGVPTDKVTQRHRELSGGERPWTDREREFLRKHWIGKSAVQLGAALGRGAEEIVTEAEALGLLDNEGGVRSFSRWTPEEEAIVRRHYPGNGAVFVAKMLGRQPRAVLSFAKNHGIKMRDPGADWTPEQDAELLRLRFEEGLTYGGCAKALCRTTLSIKARLCILKKKK